MPVPLQCDSDKLCPGPHPKFFGDPDKRPAGQFRRALREQLVGRAEVHGIVFAGLVGAGHDLRLKHTRSGILASSYTCSFHFPIPVTQSLSELLDAPPRKSPSRTRWPAWIRRACATWA